MVQALVRDVMRPAQQLRGCRFAQVYRWANAPEHVDYVEEWDEVADLRSQFRSARFARLLEVLETAAAPPVVEFKDVSGTHGLEFIDNSGVTEVTESERTRV